MITFGSNEHRLDADDFVDSYSDPDTAILSLVADCLNECALFKSGGQREDMRGRGDEIRGLGEIHDLQSNGVMTCTKVGGTYYTIY